MTTGNWLLDSLPEDLKASVMGHLEPVHMPHAALIAEFGQRIEFLYFPTTCLASLVATTESGNMVEASTVGHDGFVGITALFAQPARASMRTMVQIEGDALRMPITQFVHDIQDERLRRVLGEYAMWVLAVINQSAACLAFHPVQERLARWLLMVQSCTDRGEFPLTQDFMAIMLGSHRPTVSIAVAALEQAGFIEHRRGLIRILDNEGLQSAACECFAITEGLRKANLL